MTRLTPQQSIEKFVNTYTELYQDICKHSRQKSLPIVMWLLEKDFRTVTSHWLETRDSDPFKKIKPLIKESTPIAYVLGGMAVMVKRTIEEGEPESVDYTVDSKFADKKLVEEMIKDVENTSIDDIKNDPTNREVLIVASSNLDIPNLEFGKPEIFTGKTVDVVTMYNIIRKDTGVKGRDDVTLEVEVESIKDQIGNSSMINVLGNKFGDKRN